MKSITQISITVFLFCLTHLGCSQPSTYQKSKQGLGLGVERTNVYLPLLQDKSIALVVNQTSRIGDTHLVDSLLALNMKLKVIFAPEHGFRGNNANGAKIKDEIDPVTKLPIISLYGKNRKPRPEQLEGIDIVVFDIQDVGVRFYTYISTMHYMMETCAENGISMLIMDRPNPNGHYVDGPILDTAYSSFVGMHPIPIVHGLTIGELAQMIVGEKWIKAADQLDFKVITMNNWTHGTQYSLPVTPSPNLPNDQSIALYPSLCLFEGTNISVGRGTAFPFQIFGYPEQGFGSYQFMPVAIPGVSDYPKHEGKLCYGTDLRGIKKPTRFDLKYLISAYQLSQNKETFFNSFFVKLAGTDQLQIQIQNGLTEEEIKESWQEDLSAYKKLRLKYLLYKN